MSDWTGDLADFRGADPKPHTGKGGIGLPKRTHGRIVATRDEWHRLCRQKLGPCRACQRDRVGDWIELHHVVFRSQLGDDVADNLIPLHAVCHALVHARDQDTVRPMLTNLSDAEYAYAIEKGGEGFFERAYGLIYERAA